MNIRELTELRDAAAQLGRVTDTIKRQVDSLYEHHQRKDVRGDQLLDCVPREFHIIVGKKTQRVVDLSSFDDLHKLKLYITGLESCFSPEQCERLLLASFGENENACTQTR